VARLTVNGIEHKVDTAGRVLLDVLRDDLGLTGTKYGCGEGECGACTVLLDDRPARACVVDADRVDDATVTTVEGLSRDGCLHPVQAAFVDTRALQCGYCTPGMVMSAVALLRENPDPDDASIRATLAGNICRCGGYPQILKAVRAAAAQPAGAIELAAAAPEPTDASGPADEADDHGWTAVLRFPDPAPSARRNWGWSTPGGAHLTIGADGRVVAFTGKVDAGQGNRIALARLVAAELAVATSAVRLEMGDTARAPFDLGTFGSRSMPDAGHALRLLAAATRRELVGEAAQRWGVGVEALVAEDGAVHEPGGGRVVPFGALVAGGRRTIEVDPYTPLAPEPPGLADLDGDGLRHGLVAAVTGAKRFPSDLAVPDMWYGLVLRPPSYGATLLSVDVAEARRVPDVTVVTDGDFVAVAGRTRESARTALGLLRAHWQTTPQPARGELERYLRAHATTASGWEAARGRDLGDVDTALDTAEIRVDATYTTAYIAHVPMEPRAALARVDGGSATVWVGTQRPFAVRAEVAAALGLPETAVRVVVPDFGGGFGGKHSADVAVEAARLARATGRPVRVCWTRAEELTWAYFRPAAVIDVRAAASRDGWLTGWDFTNVNSGAAGLAAPYAVAHLRERFRAARSPLPQGSYRALAATANTFARESHLDEVAAALRVDPVDLRLRHLSDARLRRAVTAIADQVGWRRRSGPAGWGLGIACGLEKDARVATVAEVEVEPDGTLHLRRLVTVVDCGAVVDPTGLRNQVAGATIMGLGGALFEAVDFDAGRIRTDSLASYRVPRFPDIPPIDVLLLDRRECPSAGAGEAPIITVAPAIANAIRAATGRRLRALPLCPDNKVR
jgi:isoquinoline 1-oxidoreductase